MTNPVKRQLPFSGPLDSEVINRSLEDFSESLKDVREEVEEIDSELSRRRLDQALSNQGSVFSSRRRERDVELASELVDIKGTSTSQDQFFSFFDTEFVHFEVHDGGNTEGYPVNRRCRVDAKFGQVTPPFNGIKSMFWTPGVGDDETVVMPEVSVSYEELSSQAADIIETTDGRNAFDSSSNDPYLIRAVYPLDSDVAEAKFNVNIVVPQTIITQANSLTVEMAPELRCGITGINYSDSALIATTSIPGMPTINDNNPLYDAPPQRFFFDTVSVVSLQIQLTSKHFVVENGRKVFYLGFREVGLYLVEFDQTWTNNPGGFTNNGVIVKLEIPQVSGITPDSTYFDTIEIIETSPELADGLAPTGTPVGTNTGVHVMVFEDDTLGSVAFDSVTGSFPYTVTGSRDHLWLAIELDRNNATGDVPVLEGLHVEYTTK